MGARLQQQELMGLLCAHAGCRLREFSGRTVAELASAMVKVSLADRSFATAVVNFCTGCQEGVFTAVRDVAMLLSAMQTFKDQLKDVDCVSAASSLAEVVVPMLNNTVFPRDIAELVHAFA